MLAIALGRVSNICLLIIQSITWEHGGVVWTQDNSTYVVDKEKTAPCAATFSERGELRQTITALLYRERVQFVDFVFINSLR